MDKRRCTSTLPLISCEIRDVFCGKALPLKISGSNV